VFDKFCDDNRIHDKMYDAYLKFTDNFSIKYTEKPEFKWNILNKVNAIYYRFITYHNDSFNKTCSMYM
jgi:hypothetical protein